MVCVCSLPFSNFHKCVLCCYFLVHLRILTGKKHPKSKLQRLRKIRLWTFGSLVHLENWNRFSKKIRQLLAKLHSLWKVRFVVVILFVLTLASGRTVLNENYMFSILVVSTKKWYSCFLNMIYVFQEICFKVKVVKTFGTFTDCHIKTCRSLKWKAIWKISSTIF